MVIEEGDPQIKKIFYDDIRDKKIAARGIHNKALRNKGFRGGVRFQNDNLSLKQIERHLAGEVIIYNMYDNIPTYEQFKNGFTTEQKVQAMSHWINDLHLNKIDILTGWGVDPKNMHYFYDTIRRLKAYGLVISGESESKRGGNMKTKKLPKQVLGNENDPDHAQKLQIPPKKPNTVFTISWNELGVGGEELANRLTDIATIINKSKKYIAFVELGELREG